MTQIFISYKHDDGDFAELLRGRSSGRASTPGWTKHPGGRGMARDDRPRHRDSAAVVVIMTPDARGSEYVTYEWAYALGLGVPVIPVLLKDATRSTPRLEVLQYLDFTRRRTARGRPDRPAAGRGGGAPSGKPPHETPRRCGSGSRSTGSRTPATCTPRCPPSRSANAAIRPPCPPRPPPDHRSASACAPPAPRPWAGSGTRRRAGPDHRAARRASGRARRRCGRPSPPGHARRTRRPAPLARRAVVWS